MSVSFFGWESTYDDASPHSLPLAESQVPKDRGVYTMYHGTSVASARLIIACGFKQSSDGMLGKGVYVSRNQKKAQLYPQNCHYTERVILEVRVCVGRVKRIDKDKNPWTWNQNGYDTAWVPPKCGLKAVLSGMEEDCGWMWRVLLWHQTAPYWQSFNSLGQGAPEDPRDETQRTAAVHVCSARERRRRDTHTPRSSAGAVSKTSVSSS